MSFSSAQFGSVAQSCPTLRDPMNRSTPGLPVPGFEKRSNSSPKVTIFCLFIFVSVGSLGLTLSFDVLGHQQMVTIVDNIGEMGNPVTKDNHTGFFCQL